VAPRHEVFRHAERRQYFANVYPDGAPSGLDKQYLLKQLNWQISWYHTRATYAKAPKSRQRQLETVLTKLKQLQTLLNYLRADKTWLDFPGAQHLNEALGGALDIKSNLNEALTRVLSRQVPADEVSRELVRSMRAGNPTEWLRGTALPKVYTRCFRQRCTVGLESRCIRFIGAVLDELSLSCSRETIRRNITDARRSPGVRRKRSGEAVSQAISKSAPRRPREF
jgi:hypothetical protein